MNPSHTATPLTINPHKNVTRAECAVSVVRIARAYNLGTVPVGVQKSDTAEVAAKKIHEALLVPPIMPLLAAHST